MPAPVFFLDRCLGKGAVAQALRAAGVRVEVHDDRFAKDCPDEQWIRAVGKWGWIILTKDKRVRRNSTERRALADAQAVVFMLSSGNSTGAENAAAYAAALAEMTRLFRDGTRPIIAGVSMKGEVKLLQS